MTHPLNVKIKTQITKEFTKFFTQNDINDLELVAQIHALGVECNKHVDSLLKKFVDDMRLTDDKTR